MTGSIFLLQFNAFIEMYSIHFHGLMKVFTKSVTVKQENEPLVSPECVLLHCIATFLQVWH